LTDEATRFKATRPYDLLEPSDRASRKDYALGGLYLLGYPNQLSAGNFPRVDSWGASWHRDTVFDLWNVFSTLGTYGLATI
jgi:hypothetical protein